MFSKKFPPSSRFVLESRRHGIWGPEVHPAVGVISSFGDYKELGVDSKSASFKQLNETSFYRVAN
jgi:hypothetical protein